MADENNCGCGDDISIVNPFNLDQSVEDNCDCTGGGLVLQEGDNNQSPNEGDGCCVISVNGKDGVVLLNTDDIPEGNINLYFTVQRARESISAIAPILYDTPNGIISHDVSGIIAGTYGDATHFPIITVDQWGHVTNIDVQEIANNALDPDLEAIADLDGTGYLVRIGADTWALRTIFGSNGRIVLTNGDAVANPTIIDLAIIPGLVPGTYGNALLVPRITIDQWGRITAVEEVDIPLNQNVPPHTHTLGELSNVNDDVDTLAVVGDILGWTGAEWGIVANGGVNANNGLHTQGGFVKLGGALIENTAVTTGDFSLLFQSVDGGNLVDTSVLLDSTAGDNQFRVTASKDAVRTTIYTQSWKSIQLTTSDAVNGDASVLIDQFGVRAGTLVQAYLQINTAPGFPQEIWFPTYPSARDDGSIPVNFLHTGNNGELFSSPIAGFGGGDDWKLLGNAGTDSNINFLGTTDDEPLIFKVNSQKAGRIENDLGTRNTFFGYQSGNLNNGGILNTGIGYQALSANVTGDNNTAVGVGSLLATTGNNNVGIGVLSLFSNTSGSSNTSIGNGALGSNTTGNNNTGLGNNANVSVGNLTNSTVIGYSAFVTISNALILGSINGTNGAVADTFVGIGTTAPTTKLHVQGGNPRFVTGNEGVDKVWTSNATGVGAASVPNTARLDRLSNLPAGALFTLKLKGILSVVPKKFVPSIVPAFPSSVHPSDTIAPIFCQLDTPLASDVSTLLIPSEPLTSLNCPTT